MIDPHVHLRDWEQRHKETLLHGLTTAWRAGLDAVFEMPNTDPPLTDLAAIERRLKAADACKIPIFHGLFAGLTAEPLQIQAMIEAHKRFFPRVVGFKLYAGHSTGTMGIVEPEDQKTVFQTLRIYKGVLAVHCEKQSALRPDLLDPENFFSHTLSRPAASETQSLREIIELAAAYNFKGTLHICHVSVPASVVIIEEARSSFGLKITCGVTPHHLLLCDTLMQNPDGFIYKVNPPLRPENQMAELRECLINGRIDWLETDHAPHALAEKKLSSGLPGFPIYPHLLRVLRLGGANEQRISSITHENITTAFQIDIPRHDHIPDYNLFGEYEYDPYRSVANLLTP